MDTNDNPSAGAGSPAGEPELLTREILEDRWDRALAEHGTSRIIGVNLPAFNRQTASPAEWSLMSFLPLYLVSSFLKCQQCGQCCRPNERHWDRGVVLSRDEILTLKSYYRLEKRAGKTYLKYPCPALSGSKCTRYKMRPFGCRLFPFNITRNPDTGDEEGIGLLMHCPAAREFYVTVNLFMQDFYAHLEKCRLAGKPRFDLKDLDLIRANYESRTIHPDDLAYMKAKAKSPF
ncbi:MAG: YkgJ family cysteine cluster protein [Dehalogenimonas sp.]|uniref:YkgJ family cysteine cluster protein n=1 Tax=Candidatus Dehalogenimonas loeffleri TaxID=3127115 RepID=A0ABZ2J363_9CHLR|nr:YkgJ family cysteine cluster protein [Dehalogenimonas sp.]